MTGTNPELAATLYAAHQGGSIGAVIIAAIQRFPQRIAFVDGDSYLTYARLGECIGQAMAAFKHLGLQRGDGVMQLTGNRSEVFIIWLPPI